MKILGNIATATKFYILNSNNSIEWVPTLSTAKKYVENPIYKEWFGKDIYATNEDIILDKDGIQKLRSQIIIEENNARDVTSEYEIFKDQGQKYIDNALEVYAKKNKYDNIYTMISWKSSTIKTYSTDATNAIKYRDTVYTYHFGELEKFIENAENKQLDELYALYLENFPQPV